MTIMQQKLTITEGNMESPFIRKAEDTCRAHMFKISSLSSANDNHCSHPIKILKGLHGRCSFPDSFIHL